MYLPPPQTQPAKIRKLETLMLIIEMEGLLGRTAVLADEFEFAVDDIERVRALWTLLTGKANVDPNSPQTIVITPEIKNFLEIELARRLGLDCSCWGTSKLGPITLESFLSLASKHLSSVYKTSLDLIGGPQKLKSLLHTNKEPYKYVQAIKNKLNNTSDILGTLRPNTRITLPIELNRPILLFPNELESLDPAPNPTSTSTQPQVPVILRKLREVISVDIQQLLNSYNVGISANIQKLFNKFKKDIYKDIPQLFPLDTLEVLRKMLPEDILVKKQRLLSREVINVNWQILSANFKDFIHAQDREEFSVETMQYASSTENYIVIRTKNPLIPPFFQKEFPENKFPGTVFVALLSEPEGKYQIAIRCQNIQSIPSKLLDNYVEYMRRCYFDFVGHHYREYILSHMTTTPQIEPPQALFLLAPPKVATKTRELPMKIGESAESQVPPKSQNATVATQEIAPLIAKQTKPSLPKKTCCCCCFWPFMQTKGTVGSTAIQSCVQKPTL
ncbi:MAG: hypothetical protein WCW01_04775 [Gammaproteobacteria bacterium]